MRWKLTGCYLCFALYLCCGQNKQDYNWIIGQDLDDDASTGITGLSLDFNTNDIVKIRNKGLSFSGYCTSISNKDGSLLFYSNGCAIANSEHEVMPHGDSLNRGEGFFELLWGNDCINGYPGRQNIITLPDPGNPDGYYLLHMVKYKVLGSPTIVKRLLYTYIDMRLEGGLGDVTKVNQVLIDTVQIMESYLTAMRHSNGKDWWVLVLNNEDNYFFTLLITEEGIQHKAPQIIGSNRHWNASGGGFSRFSPDGSKYAYFNVNDELHLYDFDRTSGQLSNFQKVTVGDSEGSIFAGHEWSPNGRFIYIVDGNQLYQVDTWEADIEADGIRLIDVYDGTLNPFTNSFESLALGPDCKIYVRPKNDTYSWHIIYRPDELGTDCRFVQNAIHFPNPAGNGTLPNFPRFRVDEPDPCDPTITSVFGLPVTYTKDLVTYPNPVSTLLTVEVPEEEGQFVLRNMDGRVVYEEEVWAKDRIELDVSTFPTGIYQASYWTKDQKYVYVNGVSVVR